MREKVPKVERVCSEFSFSSKMQGFCWHTAPVSEPNKALHSRWCLRPRTIFEKTVRSMRCSLISLGNVRHWVGVVIGNV